MTPLYDILTAQPVLNVRQIEYKQMKLAMAVGNSRYHRFDQVYGRHFVQTAARSGVSKPRATALIEEIADRADAALDATEKALPMSFRAGVADAVRGAVKERVRGLVLSKMPSE